MRCNNRALPDVADKGSAPVGGCCGRERPGSARVGYTFELAFPAALLPFHLMSLHAPSHVCHEHAASSAVLSFVSRLEDMIMSTCCCLLYCQQKHQSLSTCEYDDNAICHLLGETAVLRIAFKQSAVFLGHHLQAHRIDSGTYSVGMASLPLGALT